MAPLCGPLLFLAAISVFADASKTYGQTLDGTTPLLDVSAEFNGHNPKVIRFNDQEKLDVIIDQVKFNYQDGCMEVRILKGGPGKSHLKAAAYPISCFSYNGFSLIINGRKMGNVEQRIDKTHYSIRDAIVQ